KIRKFDFDGNTIWQHSIFAPGPVWPLSCQISRIENENFMILFSAATSSSNNNDHDITLVKMDQHGNEIWKKTYNWKGSDISKKLIQTADGKYTMVSSASGFGNGGFDVMLSKIDINGEIIWEKVFGGANSDQGANLLERSNGNLVILGNTNEGNTSDAIFDF